MEEKISMSAHEISYEMWKDCQKEIAELKKRLEKSVELPFIAMVQQQLNNKGEYDKSNAEQSKNGRYCVVYLDKKLWEIPLIDVCSRQTYGRKFAENRLKELEDKK